MESALPPDTIYLHNRPTSVSTVFPQSPSWQGIREDDHEATAAAMPSSAITPLLPRKSWAQIAVVGQELWNPLI